MSRSPAPYDSTTTRNMSRSPAPYDPITTAARNNMSRSPSRGGGGGYNNWDPELAALRSRIAAASGIRATSSGRRATADAALPSGATESGSSGGGGSRIGLFSSQISSESLQQVRIYWI